MNYYKAIIQYDGSDRLGFQWIEGKPTIQGDLNLALASILKGEFSTRAASRTDKGVHAFAQVVKISTKDSSPLSTLKLNAVLPAHMKCLEISTCAKEFIPSMDQRFKEYRYLFSNETSAYIAKAPTELDIEKMKTCVGMLKGKNDFKNFWSIGGIANTTLRDILECDLAEINPQELFQDSLFTANDITSCWQFRIVGTGFLKHMVRHIVGALWMVGAGRISVEEFTDFLQGEQKQMRPWKKADPRGLYLVKVSYGPELN